MRGDWADAWTWQPFAASFKRPPRGDGNPCGNYSIERMSEARGLSVDNSTPQRVAGGSIKRFAHRLVIEMRINFARRANILMP